MFSWCKWGIRIICQWASLLFSPKVQKVNKSTGKLFTIVKDTFAKIENKKGALSIFKLPKVKIALAKRVSDSSCWEWTCWYCSSCGRSGLFLLDILPARCSNVSLGPFSLAQTDSLLPFTEDSKTEKGNKLQCTVIYDTVDCFIMMWHMQRFLVHCSWSKDFAKASASCKKDMENVIDI